MVGRKGQGLAANGRDMRRYSLFGLAFLGVANLAVGSVHGRAAPPGATGVASSARSTGASASVKLLGAVVTCE